MSKLERDCHISSLHVKHSSLKTSRAFLSWAVTDAIERGELATDTDVPSLVELLVAVMWGMVSTPGTWVAAMNSRQVEHVAHSSAAHRHRSRPEHTDSPENRA